MRDRLLVTALLLTVWLGVAARAADPTALCTALKLQRAGEYHNCLLDDMARIVRGRESRFAKCEAKFQAGWRKAEDKWDGACLTTGDETAIRAQAAGDVLAMIAALTPSSSTTSTTLMSGGPCGGDVTFPGCGGSCPPGTTCWASTTAGPTTTCTCFPEVAAPCGDTGGSVAGGAVCGGACPAGQVCTTITVTEALQASCGCIPAGSVPCVSSGSAACGGVCPTGLTCTATPLLPCECQ